MYLQLKMKCSCSATWKKKKTKQNKHRLNPKKSNKSSTIKCLIVFFDYWYGSERIIDEQTTGQRIIRHNLWFDRQHNSLSKHFNEQLLFVLLWIVLETTHKRHNNFCSQLDPSFVYEIRKITWWNRHIMLHRIRKFHCRFQHRNARIVHLVWENWTFQHLIQLPIRELGIPN